MTTTTLQEARAEASDDLERLRAAYHEHREASGESAAVAVMVPALLAEWPLLNVVTALMEAIVLLCADADEPEPSDTADAHEPAPYAEGEPGE